MTPPERLVHELNRILEGKLESLDGQISGGPEELVRAAMVAKNNQHHSRAIRLLKRALEIDPGSSYAATVLCSCLREANRADEAIAVTDGFLRCNSSPLFTTRAAALCDLGRWPEALSAIRRALALCGDGPGEIETPMRVYNRIKANAPKLFQDESRSGRRGGAQGPSR